MVAWRQGYLIAPKGGVEDSSKYEEAVNALIEKKDPQYHFLP